MSAIGGYEDIVDEATDMTVAGQSVKVLTLEQLIASKKAAGRPKDLRVLPDLEAALKLKRSQGTGPDATAGSS
jgi:hypothetical protein